MDNEYKDAPEGATHYDRQTGNYYQIDDEGTFYFDEGYWEKSNDYDFVVIPKQEPSSLPQPEQVEETNLDIWENAPEGAEWYWASNKKYYGRIKGKLCYWDRPFEEWTESSYPLGVFLEEGGILHYPPKEAPVEQQPYVDWSKAPEGCNAVFYVGSSDLNKGVPSHISYWEQWSDGVVYEWSTEDGGWSTYGNYSGIDKSVRIFRPKEEIVSAKRKNDVLKDAYKPWNDITVEQLKTTIGFKSLPVPDYSKIPAGTRVVEPVESSLELHQVHKYIKDNLKLETAFIGLHMDRFVKLVLDGEVISEIEV